MQRQTWESRAGRETIRCTEHERLVPAELAQVTLKASREGRGWLGREAPVASCLGSNPHKLSGRVLYYPLSGLSSFMSHLSTGPRTKGAWLLLKREETHPGDLWCFEARSGMAGPGFRGSTRQRVRDGLAPVLLGEGCCLAACVVPQPLPSPASDLRALPVPTLL